MGVREGACIGVATMSQPWTLRSQSPGQPPEGVQIQRRALFRGRQRE